MDNFAAFVLSHKRPERVHTVDTLRKVGYTGDLYVIVDDKDPDLPTYRKKYGDQLLVFSKDEIEPRVDLGDAKEGQGTVIYAREAAWDFAEDLGLDYFLVLDDDYDWFRHRIGPRGEYLDAPPWIEDMDAILEAFVRYMEEAPIDDLAFSQGGDWIGGANSSTAGLTSKRKAMNAHLLATDRYFDYPGRLNDDVNAYVKHGHRGRIFLTYIPICLNQEQTQQEEGGLTEEYMRFGTYAKSFHTVMHEPSCTTITAMGENHLRLHHEISWDNAVPKIVPESYRKTADE